MGIEKDVFGLQVMVNDIVLVQMFKGRNELCNIELSAWLLELAIFLEVPE